MKFTAVILVSLMLVSFAEKKTPTVLIFSKTGKFHHESIPAGIAAIQKLAQESKFRCDTTTDSLQFNTANLDKYDAVIFLNTTGNVLSETEQDAFINYIHSGHGYVGVHAASDTEFDWPWYNRLVGAYFINHPDPQTATLNVVDKKFIATKGLPASFNRFEEWYNFKDTHWDEVNILITVDEASYKGGTNGKLHPISWYHQFEGGRSFYTALGHTDAIYSDTVFLKHLLGGIRYAIGK